jgi:purine-binding chemotaxis protein CheW
MPDNAQYVTLGVADELFAAPVERVREILDMRPVAKLPQAPRNLLGIIDVRGQGIPVLDLRLTLGMTAVEDTMNTRIVVLSVMLAGEARLLGLRTDRVFEVTVLDSDELDPPPAIGGRWAGHCIAGIGRRKGRFVTVLDLDRLFAATDLGEIATPAAELAEA